MTAQFDRRPLLIVLILVVAPARAQHRNDNWLFAPSNLESGGRLNFTAGSPQVDTAGLYQMCEGFGTISDTQGNLLFSAASGGFPSTATLFDANLDPMPNGVFSYASASTTQGSLIVPRPGSADLYDVFYLTANNATGASRHLVVDLSLHGGLGDVVGGSMHQFVDSMTEKLTGTLHANGNDYWILMHKRDADGFLAYSLTSAGLDTVPVVSHAGSAHVHPEYTAGQMKVSHAGDRIGLCARRVQSGTQGPSIVQLFDFNNATGEVSYWTTLPDHRYAYGCELSSNGCMFYVAGMDTVGYYIDQYDLCSDGGDTAAVQSSRTRLYQFATTNITFMVGAMTTAPDGRIYIVRFGGIPILARINEPNLAGAACDLDMNAIDMTPVGPGGSHCNQIKNYHDSQLATGTGPVLRPEGFSIRPNPAHETALLQLSGNVIATRVIITDALGRSVVELKPSTTSIQPLDISGLKPGVYQVMVFGDKGSIGEQKLVVK